LNFGRNDFVLGLKHDVRHLGSHFSIDCLNLKSKWNGFSKLKDSNQSLPCWPDF
jgi:hypothetical protein